MEIFEPYFALVNQENLWELLIMVLQVVGVISPLLVCVAYLTWAERKVIASMQLRKGPTHVGWAGLGQPIADAVKLLFKENAIPANASKVVYMIAPMMVMIPAVIAWAVIPFDEGLVVADVNLGVMYLLATSALGVYGVLMAGWSSNSKYPFLGAVRTGAQMVSY